MIFVPVSSKGGVSSLFVSHESFERHSLCRTICLVRCARCGPIHRLLEPFHGFCRQLDLAVAGLAILQLLYVFLFESEAIEIGELRWITELSNREKIGKPT